MYWNFSDIIVGAGNGRFGRHSGTVALEIGFGNGEYLRHLALSERYSLVVGIEVSQWCVTKAARRALAGGSRNIRLMCGDARHIMKYAFEPESVSGVFMNFPCPWPKRRHAERRVARNDFAELLASYIAPGGEFTLATDVGWYARDTRDVFASCDSFDTGPAILNPERDYVTKYERKWRAMGRDTFQLTARKKQGLTEARTDIGDDNMTECTETISQTGGDFRQKVASLEGNVVEGPDYRAMFRDIYWNGDDEALVKIISVDEGFEQHYHIRIENRRGRVNVRTDPVGHPYKTPSVREAVKHAALKLSAKG
ncbi:MAG: tRNA (guanosine(46)-N7)-methyltransferase TrmB [Synergistaceae bacterium]|jgi:tRNA (guanine-N7-)-methyltransferase|nr:tRNA (guanosine(46)-N7)-methyltransferase TrmB [Synergistaceae bacterium]